MSNHRKRILNYIVLYKYTHDGLSPTIREICRGCKIASTSTAVFHLNIMESKGILSRMPGEPRGIMLTHGRWSYLPMPENNLPDEKLS